MKTITTYLFVLLAAMSIRVQAQDFSLKYGKITNDEVAMTSYDKDTTANAVVLYKRGDAYYDYLDKGFRINYEYETKIKIFNQDGADYANVTLSLYHEQGQNLRKETISRIEAHAYNLENGKIVKTKMDKSYIFEERVSPNRKLVKFSVPAVKAGTVIEYRYKIISDFPTQLDDWGIQQSIPIIFAQYEVKIPEYFKFRFETKGYEHIKVDESPENQSFTIRNSRGQSEAVQCTARKLKFTSTDVPAMKDDNYVWCVNDFMSHVTFELDGVMFPYETYKPFTQTWEDIEKTLKESDAWGDYLRMRNPFKDEMASLPLQEMNNTEKITAIFNLLRSKLKWNESYGFIGEDVKKALKNGTGTNAEFNFILMSMLKDAGIQSYPILLSHRTRGRLPLTYPSLNKISTFIVGALDSDTTMVYIDGSIKYGTINQLPPVLMVDRARLFNPKEGGYWVNLTNVGKNSVRCAINATIGEDGTLTGKRQTAYTGVQMASYKHSFYNAKDSLEFIEKRQKNIEVTINNYQQSGMEQFSPQVREIMDFTKNSMATDDRIYLNPMIFPHITENNFTDEERKLPVEFGFPYEFRLSNALTIPEGYEIEETPENLRFSTEDGGISCLYTLQHKDGVVTVNYVLQFKKIIFSQLEYPSLKIFWEKLIEKNNEQIILKKITDA